MNATRIVLFVFVAIALFIAVLAAYGQRSTRPAPRVMVSLVDPADYPDSPHEWPSGPPISRTRAPMEERSCSKPRSGSTA